MVAPVMRHWARIVALVLVLLIVPAATWGARPLETEDTGTAERVEIETSVDYEAGSDEDSWTFTTAVNVGLLPNLEASVQGSLVRVDPDPGSAETGIGDSLIGLKYRFFGVPETGPSFLARLTLRLPTGDESKGLGDDGVDVGLLLAGSAKLGAVILTGNVGYTFVTEGGDLDFVTLGASLEWPIPDTRWTLVAEVVSEIATGKDADDTVVIRGGFRYALYETDAAEAWLKALILDGAVGVGLTSASPDAVATVGLSLIF
jgi:hypothetical protein